MIEINGLDERQRELCEILWVMESFDEVETFINLLEPHEQRECRTLVDLMVMATIDHENDRANDEVKHLINQFRLCGN